MADAAAGAGTSGAGEDGGEVEGEATRPSTPLGLPCVMVVLAELTEGGLLQHRAERDAGALAGGYHRRVL